jgi:hypothetical protein
MRYIGKWQALDGELERLRGGFGGVFGWIALVLSVLLGLPTALLALVSFVAGEASMGLCCGSFALAMAVFGLWPLLRSASYILTNRRLLVTWRFGSPVAIPLARINRGQIAVDPLTSSLTLHGERPLSLRFIGGGRHLWSLLLLPASEEILDAEMMPGEMEAAPSTPLPHPSRPAAELCAGGSDSPAQKQQQVALKSADAPREPVDFIYWNALRIDGVVTQKGVALLRPDYFMFLPAAAAHNLVAMTGGVAAGIAADIVASAVAGAVAGADLHLESKAPFEVLLGHLSQCDAATFDTEVGRLAQEFDALVWKHGEAVVDRQTKTIPFQGRYVVNVHNRTTGVSGSLRRHQLPAFQRLCVLWPEVPDFEYRSVGANIFLTVMLLFFSAFSGCAIYFAIVEPNWLGTVATVFITLLTLVGWFGWFRTLWPKRSGAATHSPHHDLRHINAPRFEK